VSDTMWKKIGEPTTVLLISSDVYMSYNRVANGQS
jgi:hypothetical protein